MPTTVLQATVGAGKTEAALERLDNLLHNRQRPFAKAWVLLATKRQEVDFRQRLTDLTEKHAVYFNAEFFNFYELNARVLNLAGSPQRKISEPARLGLLRKILQDMLQQDLLTTFKPIAKTSGFLQIVADLIYELKQNRVEPEVFVKSAKTQKDKELATIYATYQDFMQGYNLVDREGEGWLALEKAEKQTDLASNVDLLLVDGYDQFTLVQAALIAALSKQVKQVAITLTHVPDNDEDDTQQAIGKRFKKAYETLKNAHEAIGAEIAHEPLREPQVTKHPDLLALGEKFFSGDDPVEAQGAIQLIEAPEPAQEVAATLREVKRLLLSGERPDDMLIALRDYQRYFAFFEIYARQYNLPLLLHHGSPIAKNPAITVLMNLLALSGKNPNANTAFRRRDLLDVLRSPYIAVPGFNSESIDLLEKVSQQQQVLGGRQNWLDAIKLSTRSFADEENPDDDKQPLLSPQQEADLSIALEDFMGNITPKPHNTLLGYVMWLENLIGQDTLENPDDEPDEPQPHIPYTLNMPRCIRAVSDDAKMENIISRDVEALNLFKDFLRDLLSTQDFLKTALGQESAMLDWATFYDDLQSGVKNASVRQRNPIRSGRVLVTTVAEARGLPHEHVFVPGLSEGIFPAEVPEDPIYLDSERQRLHEVGVILETAAERADDNGLFYELISLPRKTLTLSRPYIREGKPWVESHLWRMTKAVYKNLEPRRYGIGDVVPIEEVSSLDEVLLAVADGLNQGGMTEENQAIYAWLNNDDSAAYYWGNIANGRSIETSRLSRNPYDEFTGQIRHPDLLEIIEDTLSNRRVWSASQLNEYGSCPYRFFASRLLRLESLDEPEEGLNALQLGSVNHAILERTYSELASARLEIIPENLNEALATLEEQAREVFRNAPAEYGFRPTALWREEQQVIYRRLQNMILVDFSEDSPLNKFGSPRVPYKMEQKFGMGDNLPAIIGLDNDYIKVRGAIDRIDRIGDELIVIDYKTGSSPIKTQEMEEGRNFQMMVYLLALEHIVRKENWGLKVAGGMFWHIRNQNHSGLIQIEGSVNSHEAIQSAKVHLSRYLHAMRHGYFAVKPSKIVDGKCASYCDFYQLCRLTNTQQYKQD